MNEIQIGKIRDKGSLNWLLTILHVLCFFYYSSLLNAQFIVNGPTARIVCTGTPQIVLNNISYHNEASSTHFTGSNSTLKLIGGVSTNFTSVGGFTSEFSNVLIQKVGSQSTLLNPVNVTGTLTMLSGNVITSATNILSVGTSVGTPGSVDWTSGTIVGPMRRWFNTSTNSGNLSGLFPVGNNPSTVINRWARFEYSGAPTSPGYLTVEFKGSDPSSTSAATNGLPLTESGITLTNLDIEGYWEVQPEALVGGIYTLTTRANTFLSVSNYAQSRIVKSPNPHTIWTLNGSHGTIIGSGTDYEISRNGMTGFSYFAIAYPISALPVELSSFAAICNESGEEVTVRWATASEHNSSHFTVDRSFDGNDWEVLGTVHAAGNSTLNLNYELTDSGARGRAVVYYRLNQVDYDGASKSYGPTSAACLNDQLGFEVFPNPAGTDVTVLLHGEHQTGETEVIFTDLNGKEVNRIIYNEQTGKLMTVVLRNLEPGVYLVRLITSDTNDQFVRLIKQ